MNSFQRRLRRALQRYGFVGFLRLGMKNIASLADRLRPSIRSQIRERVQREIMFDKQFGVDTAGRIHQVDLEVNHHNQLHAIAYGGSDPKFFREAIRILPIDYKHFVFVDFGSGKGRAILMAMEYPFKRIVGVEFSEQLHRIAQDNITRYDSPTIKCTDAESLCLDVVDYTLPTNNLVCYFCNPFDATIMTQVISQIRVSLFHNPREIFIVYYNPSEAHVIDVAGCFTRIGMTGPICIWKSKVK